MSSLTFKTSEQIRMFESLLDENEAALFAEETVESVTIVYHQNMEGEKMSDSALTLDFPQPSAGLIGRKTTENQSSSKSRLTDGALKMPRVEDKTGNIAYIKGFVLAKCQVYWQFSAGGRYNKLASRILVSNETFDRLDLQGLQQYMYLSSTGSNVAHMSELKLGSTYQFYGLKFYKISDTIKIANWKNGAYANEVHDLKPEMAEFRSVENFGTGSTTAGVIVDVCISSYCNCASLIGPSHIDPNFISTCPKCKSNGIILLEDGAEVVKEGGAGLLTLVNIITHEGELPVQCLVHPNFTSSKLSDLVLDVGMNVEVLGSRMLNSRNLIVVFEILGFSGKEKVEKKTVMKEDGSAENGETAEFKAEI